jgi:hypothetical protein
MQPGEHGAEITVRVPGIVEVADDERGPTRLQFDDDVRTRVRRAATAPGDLD